MAKKITNFEQAVNRLDEIIGIIEDGGLPLNKSVQLYKEGIELSLFCSDSLKLAENEVMELRQAADNSLKLVAFDVSEKQ